MRQFGEVEDSVSFSKLGVARFSTINFVEIPFLVPKFTPVVEKGNNTHVMEIFLRHGVFFETWDPQETCLTLGNVLGRRYISFFLAEKFMKRKRKLTV